MEFGEFEGIVDRMEQRLDELKSSGPYHASTSYQGLPNKGIYVFYEEGKPMYAGRVGRQTIKKRIQQHTRPSSGHNSATFAFILLQEKVGITTGHGAELNRAQFAEKYEEEFKDMKGRVRNMEVRAVEISDSALRTVFEVYASLALKTPYNNFDES